MLENKFLILFFLAFFLICPDNSFLRAEDYSSANFILRDPIITVSGGRSTAASFEFFSSAGQTAPGESTSSNYIYRAGFLYFAETAVTAASASGTGSVSGGAATAVSAKVIFSGRAYPGAAVVLLKDAQIIATVLADKQANFTIEIGNLFGVDYLFSIYAKDYSGRSSRLILFPLKLELNKITSVNNILISPTILQDKKEVKKGQTIDIFGQSIPNANIAITIKTPIGAIPAETLSDKEGKYKYVLDTSLLDFGEYQATSQVFFGKITSISSFARFIVGDETIIEEPSLCPLEADLNNDCAVNLVDFSILIYWFNRSGVPPKVDLNNDGTADLVDFSILAYYWTG